MLSTLPTPSFIFDEEAFCTNVKLWQDAILQHFKSGSIGYSVKTNSLPYAIQFAHRLGCKIEVVSHDEYSLARTLGIAPKDIIYNGPQKSKETFLEAIIRGAAVNIETQREIDWLSELPDDNNRWPVGIRVNVDISQISPGDAKDNDTFSRFGFCFSNGELLNAIQRIGTLQNVRIAGLHFHRTSLSRSLNFYRNLASFAASIISQSNLSLDYVDMGGGFYGVWHSAPSFDEYISAIATEFRKFDISHDIQLIIEPGNGLLANAFHYIAKVIDVKKLEKSTIITIDGSRNDIDPLFKKSNYLKEFIYSDYNNDISLNRQTLNHQIICGATCLEFDKLFELNDMPELCSNDRIYFKNVGAYTMALSGLFINFFPDVYAKDSEGLFKIVRPRWTASKLLND